MASAGVRNAANTPSGAGKPYRKRTGTKTHKIRELLKAHVVRRGPASVRKLESIAKARRVCWEYDQGDQPILQFPKGHEELNVERPPVSYGPGASYGVATKATCVDSWIWLVPK